MFTIVVLFLIIIAVIHFIIKKKELEEELKMTKQVVTDERSSKEIDPEIKKKQRQKAAELLSQSGMEAVSTADVVVTNPTHYAVALKYEKGTDSAPLVVSKGHDMVARRIKTIAVEFDVPMVENKIVARTLYALCRVGESIPFELFQVVAQILAEVYNKHSYYFHRLKARRLLLKKLVQFHFSEEIFPKFKKSFLRSRRKYRTSFCWRYYCGNFSFGYSCTQRSAEHSVGFQYRNIDSYTFNGHLFGGSLRIFCFPHSSPCCNSLQVGFKCGFDSIDFIGW